MSLYPVCSVSDLEPTSSLACEINLDAGGVKKILVARDEEGNFHALDLMCTHADVALDDSDIEGCEIECWAHGARFNLNTGEGTLPAPRPLKVYPVRIEDETVFAEVEA